MAAFRDNMLGGVTGAQPKTLPGGCTRTRTPFLADQVKEDADAYDVSTPPYSRARKRVKRSPKQKGRDLARAVLHKQREGEKAEAKGGLKAVGAMLPRSSEKGRSR